MATLKELESAFIQADEADNFEDAQAFATELKRLYGPQQDEGIVSDTNRLQRAFNVTAPQPTNGKKERLYFANTGRIVDAPSGSSAILKDIHQDSSFDDTSGLFDEVAGTFKKQAAYLALVANAFGLVDDENISDFIANRSLALNNAQKYAPEYVKNFNQNFEDAQGWFEHAAVILSNPRAIGRMIVGQTPNSILPLVTGLIGAGVGNLPGFAVGIGVGTAIVEMGAWIDERMSEAGVDMSDADQILKVLQDDAFMNKIIAEAKRKGLSQGTVEALFAVFGGTLLKRAIPGTSTLRSVTRKAGEVGLETFGEGGGETVGQVATGTGINLKGVILESISGLGQSAGTVAISSTIGKGKPKTSEQQRGVNSSKNEVSPELIDKKELRTRIPELENVKTQTLGKPEGIQPTTVPRETIADEVIVQVGNKVESIAKEEVPESEKAQRIERELKKISPSKKTTDIIIKGRIKQLDSEISAIDKQIDIIEQGTLDKEVEILQKQIKKVEGRRPVATIQAEIEALLKQLQGKSESELLKDKINKLKEEIKVSEEVEQSVRTLQTQFESVIKEEAVLIKEEIKEAVHGENLVIKDEFGVVEEIRKGGIPSTFPPYFADLSKSMSKGDLLKHLQKIIDGNISAKDKKTAWYGKIINLINDRLEGRKGRFTQGQFDPNRVNEVQFKSKSFEGLSDFFKTEEEIEATQKEIKEMQTEIDNLEKEIQSNRKANKFFRKPRTLLGIKIESKSDKPKSIRPLEIKIIKLKEEVKIKNKVVAALEKQIDNIVIKQATAKPSKKLASLLEQREILDESLANILTAGEQIVASSKLETLTEKDIVGLEARKETIQIKGEQIVKLEEQSLTAQARSLNKGLREGVRLAKTNIKQAMRNVTDLINSITLPDILPADLKALKNSLIKQYTTVEENFIENLPELKSKIALAFTKAQRKQLITNIKDTIKKVSKAKNIAIDFVRQIQTLVEDIDLVKRSKASIDKLTRTLSFINQEFIEGEDVENILGNFKDTFEQDRSSERALETRNIILKKLEAVNKKNVAELTNEDLKSLLNEIKSLTDMGKLKLKLIIKQAKRKQAERLKAIKTDAKKIEDIAGITPESKGVGAELDRSERLTSVFRKALNIAKRKLIALTPMDVVFNMMDKEGKFRGAVFKIFKRTLDIDKRNYNKAKAIAEDNILDAVDRLKITKSQRNRILVFAELRQEHGREKLIASGYTEKALAEFEEESLDTNETELLNILTTELKRLEPTILDIMKRVYNKDFSPIKDYFPMLTDFEAMENAEIQNMFGNDVTLLTGLTPAPVKLKKNVDISAVHERKGGAVPIVLDAVDVALRHIDNALYFINHAQDLKELGELANTKDYGKAVGNIGQEITKEYIDLLAKKGGAAGKIAIIDFLRKHIGWAVLGYKLCSSLIQVTSLFDGAAAIGGYAFTGAKNVVVSSKWRKFLRDNFVELQVRMADDAAYAEYMKHGADAPIISAIAGASVGEAVKNFRLKSFWTLRKLDGIVASGIAAGAYEKIVTEKGGVVDFDNPDIDAILEAETIVRRTQSSSDFKDAPSAITMGKFFGNVSVDKAFFQFQSFMLTRFSQITQALSHQGFHLKPTQESINVATFLTLAIFAEIGTKRGVEEIIAAATGDDPEEDFSEEILEKFVKELVRTIPVVSSVVGTLNYGNVPVPVISLFEQGIKEIGIAIKTKDDERKKKHAIRAILLLSGEIGGIPGTLQVEQIIRKAWKIEKSESRTFDEMFNPDRTKSIKKLLK